MVIEKLEILEASLKNVLEEMAGLRKSRTELESQVERSRAEARSATEAMSGRDEEISRLREENTRLQGERTEVRDRVERMLNHLPSA